MKEIIYHDYVHDYNKDVEDIQHTINAWTKLGFYVCNVNINKDRLPEFNVKVEVDNAFVKRTINSLTEIIKQAHINNDFSEVLYPAKLSALIRQADEKNNTTLFDKYKEQLLTLEKYLTNKDIFSKPQKMLSSEKKVEKKRSEQTVPDGELIISGPKGVTNQGMIPAITKYVMENDSYKISQLQSLYPTVFASSFKYLSKDVKSKLQSMGVVNK
jgi:hypothetical protein